MKEPGDAYALAPAAVELVRIAVHVPLGQPDHVHELSNAAIELLFGAGDAVDAQGLRNYLAHQSCAG